MGSIPIRCTTSFAGLAEWLGCSLPSYPCEFDSRSPLQSRPPVGIYLHGCESTVRWGMAVKETPHKGEDAHSVGHAAVTRRSASSVLVRIQVSPPQTARPPTVMVWGPNSFRLYLCSSLWRTLPILQLRDVGGVQLVVSGGSGAGYWRHNKLPTSRDDDQHFSTLYHLPQTRSYLVLISRTTQ